MADENSVPNITEAPAPNPAPSPSDHNPRPTVTNNPPTLTPSITPPPANSPGVSFPENWKSALPKEFQDDPALKVIHDVPMLAKSYLNAQKMVGAEKISIPSKHATEADWNTNVFQKLGLPADVKDYKIDTPKDAPFDAASIEGFKTAAHASGILPRQANKILEWYGKTLKEQVTGVESKSQEALNQEWGALRKEWGQAFDTKILAAQVAFRDFADPEVTKWLNESKLASNPKLMKVFAKIGESLREDEVKGGASRGSADGLMTPEDAKKQFNGIMGDKNHPYNVKEHPGHKDAVAEVSKLFTMAFPGTDKS